jgi:hypothetical protein
MLYITEKVTIGNKWYTLFLTTNEKELLNKLSGEVQYLADVRFKSQDHMNMYKSAVKHYESNVKQLLALHDDRKAREMAARERQQPQQRQQRTQRRRYNHARGNNDQLRFF